MTERIVWEAVIDEREKVTGLLVLLIRVKLLSPFEDGLLVEVGQLIQDLVLFILTA